jgi:hypothetical protein
VIVSHRVFTSWVRRGAAVTIPETDPLSGPWKVPATFQPPISITKNGTSVTIPQLPELPLLGPGGVTGLSSKAVLRTDPTDGATAVEENYLAQIEFSRPDLPWIFTPAKPNEKDQLRPWIVLIVVDESVAQVQPGAPLPTISVRDTELPDLDDSWGWAHSQATVDTEGADLAGARTKAHLEFGPASGTSAISRLLCPRRLKPDRTYVACVVPATEPGRLAGLGETIPDAPVIKQAWTAGSGQEVVLPVYYSWRFHTGDAGDFKSLVLRLKGKKATEVTGFGTRKVDMRSPWLHPDPAAAGTTVDLTGAFGAVDEQPLTGPAQDAFADRLKKVLNFPADQQPQNAKQDPQLAVVGPPIYAGRHAGVVQVSDDPGWLHSLNLDPRHRIAAAYGTTYVRENQELLMARAWNQLGAVLEANRLQALAELAAETGNRMHQRHVAGLSFSSLVAIASPARTRIRVAPALKEPVQTLHATIMNSPVPGGANTAAFSRLIRPHGPLGRRTFPTTPPKVVENAWTGSLRKDAILEDGISTVAALTPPAVNNPTAGLVARSLISVVAMEAALPAAPGPAISTMLSATNLAAAAAPPVSPSQVLQAGKPVLVIRLNTAPPRDNGLILGITSAVKASMLPSIGIMQRFKRRVQIPDRLGQDKTARVMAYPQFTAPLATLLKASHPDWLLPGLGNFPDDCVTLLRENGAFVESFLAGANHEMNRELLWRGYPTDQRGTPFQYFWPRADRSPDIPPITNWPAANALGTNGIKRGNLGENLAVLLVRGELLHRFPRTVVQAAPVIGAKPDPDQGNWKQPFVMPLDDRTTAFAYDLDPEDLRSDGAKQGYFFVFSEPVTGPRFNFDLEGGGGLRHWSDLTWEQVPRSQHNSEFAKAGSTLALTPLTSDDPQHAIWDHDAADIARIAFDKPVQVAFRADDLLPPKDQP